MPSRARVTPRAKALLVEAVLDGDRSVSAVAGDYGCAWHTVHGHLVVVADAALATSLSRWCSGSMRPAAGRRNGKLAPRPGNGDGWTGGTPDWST
ncbi:transposase family protein [Rhodococcus pyridinivorans]|uniref:transposase family protein n=1 Tax=Rhodococcus pyridinivorans TaxID=103816 RepID=UPI0039F56797